MASSTLLSSLRSHLRAFRSAEGGNIMLTFALATVPLMGFVGASIDYSRANSAKAAMQAAVDATALMLSKDATKLTTAQINSKATSYFNANFNHTDVNNIAITPTYTTSGGSQIVVTGTGSVPTTFMKVLGRATLDIDVSSTVKWGNSRLRVALVLDNTGSMSNAGKMTALKSATKSLLDQLNAAAAQNGDVYVSIVPFVKDVNVDPMNYNQNWIDWTDWEAEPPNAKPSNWYSTTGGSSCPFSTSSRGFNCTNGPATSGASTTSTIPSSGNYRGLICPSVDNGSRNPMNNGVYYNGCYNSWTKCVGSACKCTSTSSSTCSCTGSGSSKTCTTSGEYEHTWRPTNTNATYTNGGNSALVLDSNGIPYATPDHSTWNGCVGDRGNSTAPNSGNYDTNVTAPSTGNTATLYPAEQYSMCPVAIMPLNYNWTGMKNLVDAMSPDGNTNQAIGLQLGWMSLVGGGPFPTPPPKDPNYTYQQVIILMTDGLNTQDRWYTSSSQIDARQKMTCDNVNAAGIILYTIQVNTDGDPTSTLLQNCAGSPGKYPDPDKFFLLTSANQLVTTFNQIGTALSNLRVAK